MLEALNVDSGAGLQMGAATTLQQRCKYDESHGPLSAYVP
jgi:hypothetical protein